jgi:hypothetical protein
VDTPKLFANPNKMEERKISASSIRPNGVFLLKRPSAQTIGVEMEEQKRVRGSIWDAFSSTSATTDRESLSTALMDHYQSTQQQLQISPYFLSFLDPIDEEIYKQFSTTIIIENWVRKRILGIAIIVAIQILFALTIAFSQMELYMLPIVYIPLIAISMVVYYSPRPFLNQHIQKIVCLYVIIYGPVFFCIRAWITEQEYIAYLMTAMYITMISGSNYALGLRFIYSVIVAFVAVASWFVLASFAWVNREFNREVYINFI